MDRDKLLSDVNLLINRPDMPNALVRIYIDRAVSDIKGYCNREDLPLEAESSVIELAAFYISKQGIEGVTSYSGGGISYGYAEGIPLNICQSLQRFVRGRVISL